MRTLATPREAADWLRGRVTGALHCDSRKVGAGDGFIAGFLMALLGGAGAADCLQRGAENAARVCTWQGAFGHGRPWRPGVPEGETAG